MNQLIKILLTIFTVLFTFSCTESSNKTTDTEKPKEIKSLANEKFIGVYCFMNAENKDTTIVRINFLADEDIRGEMIWQPWQKDGAKGLLKGKLNKNNELELIYDYTIEGSQQTETKIMKIEGDKLFIKQGELIDPKNDGHLIFKDATKAEYKTILTKTKCD